MKIVEKGCSYESNKVIQVNEMNQKPLNVAEKGKTL